MARRLLQARSGLRKFWYLVFGEPLLKQGSEFLSRDLQGFEVWEVYGLEGSLSRVQKRMQGRAEETFQTIIPGFGLL